MKLMRIFLVVAAKFVVLSVFLTMVLVSPKEVLAIGTPTYIIYVDGPRGGEIEAMGGAQPLPEGACGIEFVNADLLAWSWHSGAIGSSTVKDPLDIPNNGFVPEEDLQVLLRFTGPYGNGCGDQFVFITPATPDSLVPAGAVALVVQFVPPRFGVQFLGSALEPLPPREDPEPRPEPPDPCKIVPEFCEPPGDFVTNNPCASSIIPADLKDLCEPTEDEGSLLLRFADVYDPAVAILDRPLRFRVELDEVRELLSRTVLVERLIELTDAKRDEFLELADERVSQPESFQTLSNISVAINLARLQLAQCRETLESALSPRHRFDSDRFIRARFRFLRARLRAGRARGLTNCRVAGEMLFDAQLEAKRFNAFSLQVEIENIPIPPR